MTPAERAYHAAYRKRPDVLARDRDRKRRARAAPGGAQKNLATVQAHYADPANYAKKVAYNQRASATLMPHYVAKLARRGLPAEWRVPTSVIAIKHEHILFFRLLRQFRQAIDEAKYQPQGDPI